MFASKESLAGGVGDLFNLVSSFLHIFFVGEVSLSNDFLRLILSGGGDGEFVFVRSIISFVIFLVILFVADLTSNISI